MVLMFQVSSMWMRNVRQNSSETKEIQRHRVVPGRHFSDIECAHIIYHMLIYPNT